MDDLARELKAITIAVTAMDKKMDLHIQKSEYELRQVRDRSDMQNHISNQHLAKLQELQDLWREHTKADEHMFKELLRPQEWVKSSIRLFALISLVGGSFLTLAKLKGLL